MELRYHTPLTPAEQAALGLPRPWPLALADRVRWAEIDRLDHVNNAAYMNWFESARVRYFAHIGLVRGVPEDPRIVIRRAEIDYLQEMRGEEDYVVTVRCAAFRNTSFTLQDELWSGGTLRARFAGVIVLLTPDASARMPLPDRIRTRFAEVDGARAE